MINLGKTVPTDTVRFDMVGNHIVVEAMVFDSIKVKLIFDTGADGLYIDSTFAKRHGQITGNLKDPDPAERVKYARSLGLLRSKLAAIKVGNINTTLRPAIIDLKGTTIKHADGLAGLDLMAKYVMEINYKQRFIVFHSPATFKAPVKMPQIPITRTGFNRYLLDLEFDKGTELKVKGQAYLDLGYGPKQIGIGSIMAEKNDLIKALKATAMEVKGRSLTTEKVTYYSASMRSVKIGDLLIDTPKIRLMRSTGKGNSNTSLSFVGNYIFSRYTTVYFDFQGRKIYLDK
ncbi:pepsin/retropepsin-like aspartic protease family protein [Mucilaginibacter myungsuensis]|uniref:Aspartyl protease n=2 Tax=Mucilaginibacter myungsuensis TaxID=649104 RepID=A0A929L0G5_9SPHI|nr:hypothetical protein [Mucilaginibacter myungsuensis]MBE9664557.1 hypothetical protein [Mucilaginibacter myungsuensis]MDN3601093.1 hypothetical protein [Mucilaginibacter myungsuensis]